MHTHEFSVPAGELDAGGTSFDFPVRAAWVRGVLEGQDATSGGADGALHVRLSKSGTDVVIRGTVRVDLAVPCARCLEPAHVHIDKEMTALMVKRAEHTARGAEDEYEFSADEADTVTYDGETVVLDDLVRDEIVLEIPMIPLCSPDCPGMSVDARERRPISDPRLAPLLNFKPPKH